MADSMIYRAKTVKEAIQLALDDLSVSRSEIEVEVLNQPKKFVFGMITTFAEIKVKLKAESETEVIHEPEEPFPDENKSESKQAGLVSISNGELKFLAPKNQEPAPRILFDDTIEVFYNGEKVSNSVVLDDGLDPLEIRLPEDRVPSKKITIDVSEDKLKAVLRCQRIVGVTRRLKDTNPAHAIQLFTEQENIPAPKVTLTEIKAAVEEAGIVHGIDYQAITNELLNQSDFEIIIAKGQAPIYPQDAKIEYLFPLNSQRNVDLEADRIDHLELNPIPNIEKGETLARKTPAVTGKNGIDVFGKIINAGKPKDYEIKVGEGVALSDDQLTAYATQSGRPLLQNGEIRVLKMHEIQGDVNLATGNIRFNGEIVVNGNVTERLKVEALSGGVQIYGMVTHAQVRAARDIIISRNAISSKISAGGNAITVLKLYSFLNELFNQVSSLLTAFHGVVKMQPDSNHGRLLKKLLEIKYSAIPKNIQEFDEFFQNRKHNFENGLLLLINNMKAVFLGRGPLELTDISTVEIIRADLAHWKSLYEDASEETADITVSYLQNSTLEASGIVRVTGQGAYYSKIIAGQGYYQPRGVFRGGEISIEEGDIKAKELGGPTGIKTVAFITRKGNMNFSLVHPNVTVSIGNQSYRFEQPTSAVRVYAGKDGLEVFSGSRNLTG